MYSFIGDERLSRIIYKYIYLNLINRICFSAFFIYSCYFSVVTHKALFLKKNKKNRPNSNNKTFLSISLLCFNTISVCISKGKKIQFSELYLCNCTEKMGKMGFVLSVFLSFVFGQAKNLQGIPLCQLKYDDGTTHTVSPG